MVMRERSYVNGSVVSDVANPLPAFDVRSYGAKGDNTTDDSAAFSRAFAAIRTSTGGGRLVVPPTGSHYFLNAEVNATSIAGPLEVDGGGASVRCLVGSGLTGINFFGSSEVLIRNIRFFGTAGQSYDAYRYLNLSAIEHVTLEHVVFIGCQPQNGSTAGVIWADASQLHMRQVRFGGCGGNVGAVTPVVNVVQPRGLAVDGVTFFDSGGTGFTAPRGSPYAWFRIGGSVALSTAWNQGVIDIRNLKMDEGARRGLTIEGGAGKYEHVRLYGIRGNIAAASDAYGVYVDNVRHLVMTDGYYGYQALPSARIGIALSNISTARLHRVYAREGAGNVNVANTVSYLDKVDCDFTGTLTNNAGLTRTEALGVVT